MYANKKKADELKMSKEKTNAPIKRNTLNVKKPAVTDKYKDQKIFVKIPTTLRQTLLQIKNQTMKRWTKVSHSVSYLKYNNLFNYNIESI